MTTRDQICVFVKALLPCTDYRSLEVCSSKRNSTYCYSIDRGSLQGKSEKMEKGISLTAIKEADLASLCDFMKDGAERRSSQGGLLVWETEKRVQC